MINLENIMGIKNILEVANRMVEWAIIVFGMLLVADNNCLTGIDSRNVILTLFYAYFVTQFLTYINYKRQSFNSNWRPQVPPLIMNPKHTLKSIRRSRLHGMILALCSILVMSIEGSQSIISILLIVVFVCMFQKVVINANVKI